MDLRYYYRKIREMESTILEEFPLVVSRETADGGKPGRVSEIAREIAAKLIVEGKALIASEEQKASYFAEQEIAKRLAEKAELARRVQVAIIAEPDSSIGLQSKKK